MNASLYPFLHLGVICVALVAPDVLAVPVTPPPRTAVVMGPALPVTPCPQGFAEEARGVEPFPVFAFGEGDASYVDGYRYDSGTAHFACFAGIESRADAATPSYTHWMNVIRVAPGFPLFDDVLFFPVGWQWVEFDR